MQERQRCTKGGGRGIADALLILNKSNKPWQTAWGSYCDLYAESTKDPGRHEDAYLQEFLEYTAGLIQADLPPAPQAPAPATPPEKKKRITVKKAVAAKVQELNKSGVLTVEVRLGAVAGALAQLEESAQLEALGLLEEQAEDIEDPNEFLKNQAQVMLAAAEEG